jgi:Na+-translocating ferredoxin:NAD+ oxidoreductase RnfA subunit
MSPLVRSFFDSLLLENLVFSTFIGSLLVLLESRSTKSSYRPAVHYGFVFFGTGLLGGLFLQAELTILHPAYVMLVTGLGLYLLSKLHLTQGEWFGLPKVILLVTPLVGMQLMTGRVTTTDQILGTALGLAMGFTGAYIILGAIKEHIQLSEARPFFKTMPVLLFSLAMFSLIMAGFVFL